MPAADSELAILPTATLRRALLDRQLLLERAGVGLAAALEQVGGLQAQYAPTMYVGLWSRVAGFQRDDLTAALHDRSVVQGTLLRNTIHLVSAHDYWPMALAVRPARRAWWLRLHKDQGAQAGAERAADRLRRALAEHGQLPRKDLDRVVGDVGLEGAGMWLDLVRVPPSGTWERRRADLFAAASDWVEPEPSLDVADARALVARRYLGGFGPATARDVASWSGLPVGDVAPALAAVAEPRGRTEQGEVLFDLATRGLPEDGPAPVRLLSTWEALLLVHARRTGVLREEDRAAVFTSRNPQSVCTFLVDGVVAGAWAYRDGAITVKPFRPLAARQRRAVDEEADRLLHLYR